MEKFLKLDEITEPIELPVHSEQPTGSRLGWIQIGSTGTDAPLLGYGSMPPGFASRAHFHESDYVEIILTGSQRVGDHLLGPGDGRLVKAGTMYGPIEAGPEGCTYLVVFANGNGTNSIGADGSASDYTPWPVIGLD